jgi:hypothetical protein
MGGVRWGFLGVIPSSATSRGQHGSPSDAPPKGTGKPQRCIFINDAAMANWCFGVIGSGERFCVAPKLLHHTHCGIPAHAKGIRKKNKAKVELGAYYAPGGAVNGRPTATINPVIKCKDVPSKFLATFESGKLTASKWKDLIIDAKTDIRDSNEEETSKTNYKDD